MSTFLTLFIVLTTAIFGFVAGWGLGDSLINAVFFAIVFALLSLVMLRKTRFIRLEDSAKTRALQILCVLGIIGSLSQLIRLSVFMVDPSQEKFSTFPWSQWEVRHSCFSAYFVASEAAKTTPDIYRNSLYSLPNDDPKTIRKPRMIGPFRIDVFEYPPPFLLLPRALTALTQDFFRMRMLWFALNGLIVLTAMLLVAQSLGSIVGTRAMLLIPVVWAGLPTVNTLQKGNVQLLIVSLSMIAMVLFARKKFASGGALLAYVTASKLYPGMLIVYLLFRRQWRAVITTAVAGIIITILAILVIGWEAHIAFLKHLPGILSGEAFPAFRNPKAMATNFSIPGIIFKLKIWGIQGLGFPEAKIIGWIYTLILLAIVFVVARRNNGSDTNNPLHWLAILILATLRSPFLPQSYATFPPLWLLSLLIAIQTPTTRILIMFILGWVSLNIMIPNDSGLDPRLTALIFSVPQTITMVIAIFALRQRNSILLTPSTPSYKTERAELSI